MHKKGLSAWSAPVILVTAAAVATVFLSGTVASAATLPKTVGAITAQADAAMTTTTLKVTPTSPTDGNTTETLIAKLTPATAAGTVQFNDGSSTLGDRVAITDGIASTTVTLPSGDHSLTAVFIPSDITAFSGSTSNTVDYAVNGQDGKDGSTNNGNNFNNDNDSHHNDGHCGDEGNNHGNRHSNQRNSGINRDIAGLVSSGSLLANLASNLRGEDSHHVVKAQRHAIDSHQ